MAYFSNSGEGDCFNKQCGRCRYDSQPCPIEYVQMIYNYDAVNNKVATEILDCLVKNDGTCTMFKTFQSDFELTEDEKNQLVF